MRPDKINTHPRRMVLLIDSLESGGAQRVLSILAKAWVAQGCEVHLLTLESPGSVPFFPLDPRVQYSPLGLAAVSMGLRAKVTNHLARVRRLRRELTRIKPDLVLSFIDRNNVLALLCSRGLGIPVVVSERIAPASWKIGRIWNFLRILSYPLASGLVVQVPSVRSFFPGFLQSRIRVIPNPVPVPDPAGPALEPRPRIIAVGRLHPQKGFDLLLEAFARVRARFPQWQLDILGEGEERPVLEAQAKRLGLQDRFRLMGNRTDVSAQMRGADIFVLSSRFEGFPNVLCEAMAVGMAVVSFGCPTGPAEIIHHGVDGILVPPGDVLGLAEGLASLMGNAQLRAALATRAPEVLQQFSEQAIIDQWEDCFRELC